MKSIILAGQLALVAGLQAEVSPADALLDTVISRPGSYSQVCDVMSAPADIPYRAFDLTDFSGAGFSKANQALIGKNRDTLIKSIRSRLLAIDFKKEAKRPFEDPKPEENFDGDAYGCDPTSLNPLLLELILQLHAIETLPELLLVEQKLVEGIAMTKNDIHTAPPVVNGWFVGMMVENHEPEPEAIRDRRINLFQARVAQRDLVMLMALLMREKAYPPYLDSTLEVAYAKGLKVQAKKLGLPKATAGEPLPAEFDGWKIEIDPITRVVRREFSPVLIPYTRESRDQIRAAAVKWISENP
jgi:hypothetical protein